MTEVIKAAAQLQAFCDARAWRSCFIGGIAVQRWGEPRETIAADLTLLTGFGDEDRFIAALLARLAPLVELKEAPQILEQLERHRMASEA